MVVHAFHLELALVELDGVVEIAEQVCIGIRYTRTKH